MSPAAGAAGVTAWAGAAPGLVQLGRRPGPVPDGPARPGALPRVAGRVLLFLSGKGGVGKSTVAVNTAVALAQRGLRVGLLDADVHGPSAPRLLGLQGERLRWQGDRMVPAENFGLRVMSVGLAVPEADAPLAWRSAVAASALHQMIGEVEWGPLDVLAVDLPPGTGDVPLTLAEDLPGAEAVVVTTPQAVAIDDVRRSLRMLREKGVAVAGLVENMSGFVAPDTGALYHPFGRGGGRALAEEQRLPFLGEIPLLPAIGEGGDRGRPAAALGGDGARALFGALAARLWERPDARAAAEG